MASPTGTKGVPVRADQIVAREAAVTAPSQHEVLRVALEISPWGRKSVPDIREFEEIARACSTALAYWKLAVMYAQRNELDKANRFINLGDGQPDTSKHKAERGLYSGYVFYRSGRHDDAEQLLSAYLRGTGHDSVDAAIAYDLRGNIASRQSEVVRAIDFFETSLDIKRKIGDSIGAGITYGNMGRLFLYLGDQERAERCFKENWDISASAANVAAFGIVRNNLADAYISADRLGDALHLLDAVDADKDSSNIDIGFVALLRAEVAILSRDISEARRNVSAARDCFELESHSDGLLLSEEIDGLLALSSRWQTTSQRRFNYVDKAMEARGDPLFWVHRLRRRALVACRIKAVAELQKFMEQALSVADKSRLPILANLRRELRALENTVLQDSSNGSNA